MIVGCYSMDLYCDAENCPDRSHRIGSVYAQLIGRYERECLREARKLGWKFSKSHPRKAFCPTCAKRV